MDSLHHESRALAYSRVMERIELNVCAVRRAGIDSRLGYLGFSAPSSTSAPAGKPWKLRG